MNANATDVFRRSVIVLIAMAPMTLPVFAKAEPKILSASELDSVTAGAASAQIEAVAGAIGEHAETSTDARTIALSTPLFDLAYGIGRSHARACCGSKVDVQAETLATGQGAVVLGETADGRNHIGSSTEAFSTSWIVAYTLPSQPAPGSGYWRSYAKQVLTAIADDVMRHAHRTTPSR